MVKLATGIQKVWHFMTLNDVGRLHTQKMSTSQELRLRVTPSREVLSEETAPLTSGHTSELSQEEIDKIDPFTHYPPFTPLQKLLVSVYVYIVHTHTDRSTCSVCCTQYSAVQCSAVVTPIKNRLSFGGQSGCVCCTLYHSHN